jgi:hypothetical protein
MQSKGIAKRCTLRRNTCWTGVCCRAKFFVFLLTFVIFGCQGVPVALPLFADLDENLDSAAELT